MYISRLHLNMAHAGAARLASSPYRMHAAVEASFKPDDQRSTGEGRILWRLDPSTHNRQYLALYVVSPAKPDFTHIAEQAGLPATDSWETKNYAPLLETIAEGQLWNFRLKANPVRKVLVDKGNTQHDGVVGSLQGHVTPAQQADWLVTRSLNNGFSFPGTYEDGAFRVSSRTKEKFSRGEKTVTLSTAVFDGTLRVKDASLFKAALCCGIGRAKGFGCGLLTIAPLPYEAG